MNIKIEYDGEYPCLCSGTLIVYIKYVFPEYCLNSGGSIGFSWDYNVTKGPWTITKWPKDFPENLKDKVLEKVNNEIPWGCCGGCI